MLAASLAAIETAKDTECFGERKLAKRRSLYHAALSLKSGNSAANKLTIIIASKIYQKLLHDKPFALSSCASTLSLSTKYGRPRGIVSG